MKTSESIQYLAKALSDFQGEIENLILDAEVTVKPKDQSKSSYKFKYATLGNIVATCRPLLAKHRLSVAQPLGENGSVTTILMHESGEWICDTMTIASIEKNPQSIGSAITYTRRYSYTSMLGLIADQDDDANIAEGNQFEVKENELPKKEELPWMTDKLFNHAIEQLKNGNAIEVKEVGTLTRSQFKDWLWKTYRMKRDYKEKLDLAYKISEVENGNNTVIQ